ncbi:hypothetical protein ACN28E_33320 [Archangium lansingense]|uniref:hypothetical protein n=1 Tax=Archangium lansingense TaxID=2995310 RepID=UPI003B805AC2
MACPSELKRLPLSPGDGPACRACALRSHEHLSPLQWLAVVLVSTASAGATLTARRAPPPPVEARAARVAWCVRAVNGDVGRQRGVSLSSLPLVASVSR